jgi:hypothetical protein
MNISTKMKALLIILSVSLWINSCRSSEGAAVKNSEASVESQKDTIRIKNDELEYEITIIETGFDSWLNTQKPMTYYQEGYLRNRNLFYVSEWNRRVSLPSVYNPNVYNQFINYDQAIDYGLEVNYKLFMYFEFFQQKYRQKL